MHTDNSNLAFFKNYNPRSEVVLRIAVKLFAQGGYFQTSIHDIAREADVSIGYLYQHFGNKQGLARALYQGMLSHIHEQLDRIEENQDTAEARCRAIVEILLEMTEEDPELMDFVINARHQEFLPEEKPICSTSAFARMRGFVYQGIERGEVRPMDPLIAAVIAYGGVIRIICLRLDGMVDQNIEGFLDELWESTWQALRP